MCSDEVDIHHASPRPFNAALKQFRATRPIAPPTRRANPGRRLASTKESDSPATHSRGVRRPALDTRRRQRLAEIIAAFAG